MSPLDREKNRFTESLPFLEKHMKKTVLYFFCTLSGLVPFSLQAKGISKTVKDTVVLIGFNDFHGAFQQEKDIPGAARLSHTLLEQRRMEPNTVVLAGGDNYSGGYFPRITGGKPLKELFDRTEVSYSAIGNHEFDWGIPAMIERLNWGKTRYLAANIFTDTAKRSRPSWAQPYAIHRLQLKNGIPLKIAFIGLSTEETKTAAMPQIVKDLHFFSPEETTREILAELQDSADLYILLTHLGTRTCGDSVCFDNPNARNLTRIGGIDGIFSGHSHKEVCGLKDGIPVVQARNYGRKLAKMRFEITQDRKGRISSRFMDAELIDPDPIPDSFMDSIVSGFLKDPQYAFRDVLCRNTAEDLDPEKPETGTGFTAIGALVTKAYRQCYFELTGCTDTGQLVLGVCNLGALRTILPKGEVTRLQAGNVLPFGGILEAFRFSGKDLLSLLQYGMDCPAGWLQYHDLEVEIHDGKIIKASYASQGRKKEILPDETYTVVTERFLSSGGDGYNPQLFRYPETDFSQKDAKLRNPTDVFAAFLRGLKEIRPSAIPLPKVTNR